MLYGSAGLGVISCLSSPSGSLGYECDAQSMLQCDVGYIYIILECGL